MDVSAVTRQPLQEIGNRRLPAKFRNQCISSSPTSVYNKLDLPSCSSSVLSSSPPRSARSFAFTSSPARDASSIASSPPPETPRDTPRRSLLHDKTRHAAVSSETRDIEHVNLEISSQTITIVPGQVVHIGRKLKKLEQNIRDSTHHQDTTFKLVTIPKAAKHASRHHCSLTLRRAGHSLHLDIDVLGQNGMQLEGRKMPSGEKQVHIENGETITLGFYTKFEVKVVCQTMQAKHVTRNVARETTEQLPPVPTSEATLGMDLEAEMDLDDEDEEVEADEEERQGQPVQEYLQSVKQSLPVKLESTPSSPMTAISASKMALKRQQSSRESSHQPSKRARLSSEIRSSPAPSPYAHQDDDGYPPEDSSESEDEEALERRKHAELQDSYANVEKAVRALSLDLVGILASGIVFQPRATLTTTECIQLLLETQPCLLEHGTTEAWRPSVLAALRNGPFGVIENEGLKDAAGKKVEPDWHYSPDLDKDLERRSSLKPFVKSIRSTQRQKKQYFFKRPSDLKSRRW